MTGNRWYKGMPRIPGSGRQKGTPNKRKLVNVDEMLSQAGKHPIKEILALLPYLEPVDQVKVWLSILPYTQPKYRDIETEDSLDVTPQPQELPLSDEELLKQLESGSLPPREE